MKNKLLTKIIEELKLQYPSLLQIAEDRGETIIILPQQHLRTIARTLANHPDCSFDYLQNLTAVDYPNNFTIVYNLFSLIKGISLTLKIEVTKENPIAPSVFEIWKAADYQEREVYDMFGITFEGHPNMKRILLDDEFLGHPLRKDFLIQTKQ